MSCLHPLTRHTTDHSKFPIKITIYGSRWLGAMNKGFFFLFSFSFSFFFKHTHIILMCFFFSLILLSFLFTSHFCFIETRYLLVSHGTSIFNRNQVFISFCCSWIMSNFRTKESSSSPSNAHIESTVWIAHTK